MGRGVCTGLSAAPFAAAVTGATAATPGRYLGLRLHPLAKGQHRFPGPGLLAPWLLLTGLQSSPLHRFTGRYLVGCGAVSTLCWLAGSACLPGQSHHRVALLSGLLATPAGLFSTDTGLSVFGFKQQLGISNRAQHAVSGLSCLIGKQILSEKYLSHVGSLNSRVGGRWAVVGQLASLILDGSLINTGPKGLDGLANVICAIDRAASYNDVGACLCRLING